MAETPDQPLDIEALLAELANKIERVKTLYEQYFMGIEKIEPLVPRKEIQRAMLNLQQMYIRNTGLRFKFNTLMQKWNIYITYWNRTLREIESGTYVRHIKRAERAAKRLGQELPAEMLAAAKRPASGTFDVGAVPQRRLLDADSEENVIAASNKSHLNPPTDPSLERVAPANLPPPVPPRQGPPPLPLFSAPPSATAARAAPPPLPPKPLQPPRIPAARPPAPAPTVPGMSEQELRALHQKYLAARKSTGEATQVSYEKLCESLARQAPKLMQQPGVARVRFDVDVKDGKAILKATPLKK